jgi:tetratricopeptide (TPR) repeat protein
MGYRIQSNLIEPALGEVLVSYEAAAIGEGNLPEAVDTLSQKILDYFQTKILQVGYDKDLRPWLSHRTQHLGALKAFMQASQFIFNGMLGSGKYLNRAIELDSSFVAPRIWLISGFIQQGKAKEAQEHYQALLELESQASPFEQAMINWAGAYLADDARAQANALQLALKYSPQNNILLYDLARVRYSLQDYNGAVEALQPAISMKWYHSPAYYLLGACYSMLQKYAKARKVLEQSLSITPVYPYTYGLLSGLTFERGDNEKAEEYEDLYIRELSQRGQELGQIYAMLARYHMSMDFYEHAIRCYRLAMANEPGVAQYLDELGEALFLNEDLDAARDAYVSALELDSQWINSHKMLGIIFERMSDTSQAVHHYEAFLKQDSVSSEAIEIKRSLLRLKQ